MHRVIFSLPYALLGLVLVLGIGAFVLSINVDPITLSDECEIAGKPHKGDDCESARFAANLGLPRIDKVSGPELRLWSNGDAWLSDWTRNSHVVTPRKIQTFDVWADYWDVSLPWGDGDWTTRTDRAADIIALMPELKSLGGQLIQCAEGQAIDHPRYSKIEGKVDGFRFELTVGELASCNARHSLALARLNELMRSVPELAA